MYFFGLVGCLDQCSEYYWFGGCGGCGSVVVVVVMFVSCQQEC